MRALGLVAVALVGCGSSRPTPDLPSHAAASVAPRTGAPAIAWSGAAFQQTALPAVAQGGEVIAVGRIESDGGRGYPNLVIELRDRGDHIAKSIPVLSSNEYEQLVPGGQPSKAFTDRIAAANAELARQDSVHHFVAMHELGLQKAEDGGDAHLAMGDSFDVDWSKDHLHVFHHNTDHPLATIDGTPWLVKDSPLGHGGDVCHNPAYLRKVFHAPDINVLVVELAYHGTDTCWEPGDQFHVVVW